MRVEGLDGGGDKELVQPDEATQDTPPREAPPREVPPRETPRETPPEPADCKNGEVRPCYTVKDEQRNKGICSDGSQTCKNGKWDECIGEGLPSISDKCGDEQDNNCNGEVDENCGCNAGDTRPCGETRGLCEPGTETCQSKGKWGECTGGTKPTDEKCDEKDNNCDGQVDETFLELGQKCTVGLGACQQTGTYVCDTANGTVKCSVTAAPPNAEICDGKDNDCNGKIDDVPESNPPQTCDVTGQVGACKKGTMQCRGGQMQCVQTTFRQSETCNGIDDDCDGQTDNVAASKQPISRDCYTGATKTKGVGNCQSGTQKCTSGKWSICEGEVLPQSETCDGKDEDCDGTIDNISGGTACSCKSGEKRSCGSSTGECKAGTQECQPNGQWAACANETKPTAESCNGKDDDCDGQVDNNIKPADCTVSGAKGPCAKGQTACVNARVTCQQTVQPTKEICDGKDNDCDGNVDACKAGEKRCVGSGPGSHIEECNADCSGWRRIQTCSNFSRCSNNQCVRCQCTASQLYCRSNTFFQYRCKADCSGVQSYQRCGSNQLCYSGQCRNCKCTLGGFRCHPDGSQRVQRCYCSSGWANYYRCTNNTRCRQSGNLAWCR